jgi:hypothetical protein
LYNYGNNDDEICIANYANGESLSDDMIRLKSKESKFEKLYFIKKVTTAGSSWKIRYLKCKHYDSPFGAFNMYYHVSKTSYQFTNYLNYFSTGFPYV